MTKNSKLNEINKLIDLLDDKGGVSDGSHTYAELYHVRSVLFAALLNGQDELIVGKSLLHDDGTMFDDYFIAWVETPEGNWSFHDHIREWDLYSVPVYDRAPEWDGHEGDDVHRLLSLSKSVDWPGFLS